MSPLTASPPPAYLFCPASDQTKVERLDQRGAAAIVLDLEDAVAPQARPQARDVIRIHLSRLASRVPTYLRVNVIDSADGDLDLELARELRPHGIVLPKVENAEQVTRVVDRLSAPATPGGDTSRILVLPMIESAKGLRNVDEIAGSAPGQTPTLMLGTADLVADLGLDPGPDERELLFAKSVVVVAARAADLAAPIDGPVINLAGAGFVDACRLSRRLGFGARVCLTPAQAIEAARAYTQLDPATHRQLTARVAAFEGAVARGKSVARVGDDFVDGPVYQAARRALRRHDGFSAIAMSTPPSEETVL